MRRRATLQNTLSVLGKLAATITLTWFIVSQAGLSIEELGTIDMGIFDIRAGWLVASCLILLGGFFSTAVIWALIVRDIGGGSLTWREAVAAFMIGNLGRYVPGKVWQIAALGALARERGVSATGATAAAVLGQGAGLIGAMLIGVVSIPSLATDNISLWIVPTALLTATLFGLSPVVFNAVCRIWFRVARTEAPEGLSNRDGARWILLSLGSWCMYTGAFWAFSRGLGLDIGLLSSASAFAAAYVLGYLAIFAPAGLGVREGFLIALLSSSVGVASATGLAAAARLWVTSVEVIPAATFWVRRFNNEGRTHDHG